MFLCVSYHLDAFGNVRLSYKTRGKMCRTSAKVRATKSSRIFFTTKAHNPPHWTLNSCFGVFRTVLVLLRPFGCLAKLVSKRPELVQKLVPRSRVGIFRNESTRSNPWDPKLIVSEFSTMKAPDLTHGTLNSCFGAFRTIWMHLGQLGCLTKLGAKRAELVQKFVPRSRVGFFL